MTEPLSPDLTQYAGPEQPFRPVVGHWCSKIKLAHDHKRKAFGADAEEAMNFFKGPYDWLYGLKSATGSKGFVYAGEDQELPRPTFCMIAGTPIRMADGTEKPIEAVRVGDQVVSHTGQPRRVLRTFQRP